MHIISMRTDLYLNVCRGIFRTESKIYGGASLRKSQKNFIADVRLSSKLASVIGFIVEKVYRMSIFIRYSQSRFQKSISLMKGIYMSCYSI